MPAPPQTRGNWTRRLTRLERHGTPSQRRIHSLPTSNSLARHPASLSITTILIEKAGFRALFYPENLSTRFDSSIRAV